MISDTDILVKGIQILSKYLGDAEAQRFVALIQRESVDSTRLRQGLGEDSSSGPSRHDAMQGTTGHAGSEHASDTDESMFDGEL